MNRQDRRRQGQRRGTPSGPGRPTADRSLAQAVAEHRAGHLREAAALYRQALQKTPNDAQALALYGQCLLAIGSLEPAAIVLGRAAAADPDNVAIHVELGHLLQDLGRLPAAVQSFRRALRLQPEAAEILSDLASALKAQGRLADAVANLRRAVALRPELAALHLNLGNAMKATGDLAGAAASYREALRLDPGLAQAHNNLGSLLHDRGELAAAAAALTRAVELDPTYAGAHGNLGLLRCAQGELDAAEASCRRAVALEPAAAVAHYNLALVLKARRRYGDEAASLREAIRLDPDFAAAHANLAAALLDLGRPDLAEASLRRALLLDDKAAASHLLLANALCELGRLDEAAAAAKRAGAIEPGPAVDAALAQIRLQQGLVDEAIKLLAGAVAAPTVKPDIYRTYLASLLYRGGMSAQALFDLRRRYESLFAPQSGTAPRFANIPDPGRRIRIGYLSSDLRRHPVARHLQPLLAEYDRDSYEVHCYAEVASPDAETARLKALVDGWHSTVELDDAGVAAQIRADGIDILVCCAGHFDRNRPLVCTRHAAPVQVSLFDGASSGLAAMDYLLADRQMCPRRGGEIFSERVIGVPAFYRHPPLVEAPPVGPPPLLANGHVTFGCFNNPAKLSPDVVVLWSRLLQAMPTARLVLKYKSAYAGETTAAHFRAAFAAQGIGAERLDLAVSPYALAEHLSWYDRIDIALDPFPFNGSTATFEALWMGIPVLTLAGDTMMSRWGAAMLHQLGRPEFVAGTAEEFVRLALRLAENPATLAALRQGLRDEVAGASLSSRPERLVRHIERIYRTIWRRWCKQTAASGRPNP